MQSTALLLLALAAAVAAAVVGKLGIAIAGFVLAAAMITLLATGPDESLW